jgi:O-antigen/teichoic acid export membrane protein
MRRFLHSVASGYVVLAANTLFTLAQIPLALHYLTKEQFGLWALVVQLTGYLQFIDLGMAPSVSRNLIDHKDDKNTRVYGSIIQTAGIVLILQGMIAFVAGVLFTFFTSSVLHVAQDLQQQFRILMVIQCAVLAAAFPMRIFFHILEAHQRIDISNYFQCGLFIINYTVLWLCFAHGRGVLSLAYATMASSLYFAFSNLVACVILKLFPSRDAWGRPGWSRFRELFAFGKDLFWVALGTQMISASQTIVITRSMGLDVSGTWTVATRAFTLVTQLVWRPFDLSYAALSEMIVRNERDRLLHRFKNLVVLSCSMAVVAAVMFAICNKPFVEVWTHGKVIWNSLYDLLLGIWLIVLTLAHCHCGIVIYLKRIGFMKYIYFIEGSIFLTVGTYVASRYGIAGLISTSIIASLAFSCSYGIRRTTSEFKLTARDVIFRWLKPPIRLLALLGGIAFCAHWIARSLPAEAQLLIYLGGIGTLALLLFARFGVPVELQQQVLPRVPHKFRRVAALCCGVNYDILNATANTNV